MFITSDENSVVHASLLDSIKGNKTRQWLSVLFQKHGTFEMFAYVIFLLCSASLVFAQVPIPDNKTCDTICPPAVVNPDDVSWDQVKVLECLNILFHPNLQLLGVWFLIKQIPFFFSAGASCVYVNVTKNNETSQNRDRVETIK